MLRLVSRACSVLVKSGERRSPPVFQRTVTPKNTLTLTQPYHHMLSTALLDFVEAKFVVHISQIFQASLDQ